MLPIVEQVAKEYKERLQKAYGDEFVELVLFGSHARGNYNEDSDLDFLIVLRNPNTRAAAEIVTTCLSGLVYH